MIRPIMALLIATSLILFVWQYAAFTERIRPQPMQITEQNSTGRYDIKMVCTFDCQGNDFGFAAAKIQFRGKTLLERQDNLPAGQPLIAKDVTEIKIGRNDFHVQVTPVETATGAAPGGAFALQDAAESREPAAIARSIRVEILKDGYLIASEQIWSDQPGPFGDLVMIKVPNPVSD